MSRVRARRLMLSLGGAMVLLAGCSGPSDSVPSETSESSDTAETPPSEALYASRLDGFTMAPGGWNLVVGLIDEQLFVWDRNTLDLYAGNLEALALLHANVAVNIDEDRLVIHDCDSGALSAWINGTEHSLGNADPVDCGAPMGTWNGERLLVNDLGTLYWWDSVPGDPVELTSDGDWPYGHLADGHVLWSDVGGTVYDEAPSDGTLTVVAKDASDVVFSPDGRFAALSMGIDGWVLYDVSTGATENTGAYWLTGTAFTGDSQWLCVLADYGGIDACLPVSPLDPAQAVAPGNFTYAHPFGSLQHLLASRYDDNEMLEVISWRPDTKAEVSLVSEVPLDASEGLWAWFTSSWWREYEPGVTAGLDHLGTLRLFDLDTGDTQAVAEGVSSDFWAWGPAGEVATLSENQLVWIGADGVRGVVDTSVGCEQPPVSIDVGVLFVHQDEDTCGLYFSAP